MNSDFLSRILEQAEIYFCGMPKEQKAKAGLKQEMQAALVIKRGAAGSDQVLAEGGIIREAALLCKKAGIYPYYICMLAAAAVSTKAKEDIYISNTLALVGIRSAIEEIMNFYFEPELSYLISEAYVGMLDNSLFDTDEKKLKLMRKAYETGFKNEAQYYGCAQCTIKAFFKTANSTGEKQEYLFRAASGMAGGIAGCCDSACGAYSGANLIISSYVGRELKDLGVDGATAKAFELGRILHDKFQDVYGTNICRDIQFEKFGETYDFRIPEEKAAFDEAGAHDDKCPATVGLGAALLVEILYDNKLI